MYVENTKYLWSWHDKSNEPLLNCSNRPKSTHLTAHIEEKIK